MSRRKTLFCLIALCAASRIEAQIMTVETAKLETELVKKFGEATRPAIVHTYCKALTL